MIESEEPKTNEILKKSTIISQINSSSIGVTIKGVRTRYDVALFFNGRKKENNVQYFLHNTERGHTVLYRVIARK